MNISHILLYIKKEKDKHNSLKNNENNENNNKSSFFAKILKKIGLKKKKNTQAKHRRKKEAPSTVSTENTLDIDPMLAVKNQETQKKKRKKTGFFTKIIIFILAFASIIGLIGVYFKLTIKKENKIADTQVVSKRENKKKLLPDKPLNTENKKKYAEYTTFDEKAEKIKKNIIEKDKEMAEKFGTPKQNLIKDKNEEKKLLFNKFCKVNKKRLQEGIQFLLSNKFDFAFLGKKFKIGDDFNGMDKEGLTVSNVYFQNADTKIVAISDKDNNKCLIPLKWNKGLDIKVFYDAIDVTERLTGNTVTFLEGDSFSSVTLEKISDSKEAYFKTPKGVTIIKGE